MAGPVGYLWKFDGTPHVTRWQPGNPVAGFDRFNRRDSVRVKNPRSEREFVRVGLQLGTEL
jgi:hypothetical protein